MPSYIRSIVLFAVVFSAHPVHALGRRVLRSSEIISDNLSYGGQDSASRFTISAQIIQDGFEDGDVDAFTTANTISMDVMKALPAITRDTKILLADDTAVRFGDTSNMLDTLLVSDTATSAGRSSFAILAVDPITRGTQGVIEQNGMEVMKIHQGGNGGIVTATVQNKMEAPDWKCGVDSTFHRALEDDDYRKHNVHSFEHHREEHHDHDKFDTSILHHREEHHDHDKFDPFIPTIENLSQSLRGSKINPLNKQPVSDSSSSYNYQVDLFIEIDNEFIAKTGGGLRDEAGITLNAYNYINSLVTAANVIYESEIDTHLHVSAIKLSTKYDSAPSVNDVLTIMKNSYGGNTWHTEGVDIQHALLGKNLGGGIAYIGVICNSGWGFGLTTGISADFTSLDERVVWDLKAFMHEIGHNFGSGHSHDTNYYSPAIDTCDTSCPAQAGNKWSTLMSYCQHCVGDYGNLMYSFGGIYNGSGPKSDIANWIDNPELVANFDNAHKSMDPHREAHKMYSHVSSRGRCVENPSHSSLVVLATYDPLLKVPKCDSASKYCSSGSLIDGRGKVGPAEQGSSPNTILTCSDGNDGAYHADESIDSITVSSVDGELLEVGKTAKIEAKVYSYDPSDDFADFYYTTNPFNPTWQLIGTVSPSGTGIQYMKMQYTIPYTFPHSEFQAVRVVFRWQGSVSTSNPFKCPSGGYDDVDDLVFAVSISTFPNTTPSPTSQPTSNPTNKLTQDPTNIPTPNPTKLPSRAPTVKPTPIPTNAPTKTPSSFPTRQPTSNPTNEPTQAQTNGPTSNPTVQTSRPTRRRKPKASKRTRPSHKPT